MNETTQGRFYTDEPALGLSVALRERLLLVVAGLFLLCIHSGLILGRAMPLREFWHFAAWIICAVAGHIALTRRLPRRDPFIFPVMMLLAGWGLAIIARTAPDFIERQTIWLIVSSIALLAVAFAPGHLRWLSRYRYLWLAAGLILLILTIVIGSNPSGEGPRLWIDLFGIYFQPSELLKVFLVAFLASYLEEYHMHLTVSVKAPVLGVLKLPSLRFIGPLILMWGISIMVLAWQKDLGTATLFFVVFIAMLYIATGQAIYVAEGAILLLLAAVVGYFAFDVVRLRVDIWLNPWRDPGGQAFQIVQSLLAFSAGGVFGAGIGQGSATYIPVIHSDFVFAAVSEEWGLLGTLAVTGCLALLVMRGLRIAACTQLRPFRSFLAAGIAIMVATQSLLIMGGVLKLIPLTGVTLPFLSYGGSSLLTNFVMMGLLLVLSNDA